MQKEEKPKKISKASAKKALSILTFLKPYSTKYTIGLIFLFLTSITALVFPYLMGDLVDSATGKSTAELKYSMNEIALLLMGILTLQAVFSYFRIVLFSDVTESMLRSLRQATYSHLLHLPMSFFSSRKTGEITSRISSDISQLQETFTTTLAEFLRQFIIILGGISILVFTSPKLTGIMLCILPVVILAAVFFGRFIRKISKEVQDKTAEANSIVEETIMGISNVKAYANEFFEIARFNKSTENIRTHALRGARWRGLFASFIVFCLFGAIVAVIWFSMRMVETGEITYGDMFRFLLISLFVGASIGGIAELYAQIQKAIGSTERIFEILDEPIEINQSDALKKTFEGNLSFQNISFNYPSRPDFEVLKDVSFDVKKGETIAIVGPSGSGKTTLFALLLRFYQPQNGKVLVDNTPISDYDLYHFRNQIAIVPQDVLLFGGSIAENISYGKPGASKEEIMDAAKKANAHDFIASFPQGYETLVGDRGVQLSGGQRQRVAIARAVLKNPAILILDEATSALDSESERVVQDALDKLMKNRTTLVIAHRLSTVKNANKIVVIEGGKLKEQGTHEELIASADSLYASLLKMQQQKQ